MKVTWPDKLITDLKSGGYKKEEEEREHPSPSPDPDPDPQPDPDPDPQPETDYEKLNNLPKINGVELKGNKFFRDLGLEPLTTNQLVEINSYIDN